MTAAHGEQSAVRVFYACVLPPQLRPEVGEIARATARRVHGRPVPADNLHLTLAFIGEIASSRLPTLIDVGAMQHRGAMTLVLDRLGGFKHAGVAWLGSSRAPVELGRFAVALARAVIAAGITCDERPFHPHMTIARRCRVSPDEQPIGPYSWAIDGFALLHSEAGRAGARYRTLAKWPLTTESEHAGR
ncbi:MAG: RNA 2',3'-cyclic phosphodiesterase [Betaproteobacteria bacterium]|nr:RNA 2',3'-cyclic phosphodiesterase [Betaproteobacteria bacterium]